MTTKAAISSPVSRSFIYSVLYLFLSSRCVGGLQTSSDDFGEIHIQTFQNEISQKDSFQIESTTQQVLVYKLNASEVDIMTANVRVETTVEKRPTMSDELECPVVFAWRQRRSSKSWALPLQIESNDDFSGESTELLYSAGHTICLDFNEISNASKVQDFIEFLVFVSTCSPTNVTYSVLFTYDDTGFLINLGNTMKGMISPSITRFYRFEFPENSDHVIVEVTSEDNICMTAAVQSPWCQLANSKSDSIRTQSGKILKFQRTWQDMTTKAVIPVVKSEYPTGFFIGFAVHDTDKECKSYNGVSSSNGWLPIQSVMSSHDSKSVATNDFPSIASREKSLRVFIKEEISTEDYVKPIFLPIYFLTGLISLAIAIYWIFSYIGNRMMQRIASSNSNSDEEGLVNTDNYVDDIGTGGSGSLPESSHFANSRSRNLSGENHGSERNHSQQGRSSTANVSQSSGTKRNTNRWRKGNLHGDDSVQSGLQAVSGSTQGNNSDSDSDNNEQFSPVPSTVIATDENRDQTAAFLRTSDRRSSSSCNQNSVAEQIFVSDPVWLTMDEFIHKTKKLKKSLNKIHYLIFTVGIFYVLPTIQLLYTYHQIALTTGQNDLCYRNYLCSHQFLGWDDFNHIYSNTIYIILGFVFMVFVSHYQFKVHSLERARSLHSSDNLNSSHVIQLPNPRKGNGIIHEFGVFYALGLALTLEGILSAAYHVCPTQMNFQFDTSFMYILAVLSAIKIYQFRHADPICPHNTFGLLAVISFISVGGILLGSKFYEGIFFAFHVFFVIMTSIYVYHVGHIRDSDGNAVTDYSIFKHCTIKDTLLTQPLSLFSPIKNRRVRFIFVIPFIVLNLSIDIWQFVVQKDFPMYLLYIFAGNMMFYFVYYFFMKVIHGELFNIQSIQPLIYLLLSSVLGCLGIMYFMDKRYNASLSPAESRVMNRPCSVAQFYDTHDIWHFLSAGSIFFFFMVQ